MNVFIQLSAVAVLPVIVSIVLYLIEKKDFIKKINDIPKQIIAGLIFGGLAIVGTEFGVDAGGAVVNARDASVLTAGLIFGAGSGIIAGVIGGVERFFAVYWGAGMYTRYACFISTVLAGVIGAILRKYMFDNKKPSTLYALGIGLVTEVIHMLMIFITNMSDVERAFSFVEKCSLPMISINGIAVMLSVFSIKLIGKEKKNTKKHKKQITTLFQRWLLVCVVAAFIVTSLFTLALQNRISQNSADNLLLLNIEDVKEDISDASDHNLLALTYQVANEIKPGADLLQIAEKDGISEINIIDINGIITDSTNPDFIGYQMGSGEQSAQFMVLLNGTKSYVQSYQPISYNKSISRKYAGVALDGGGFVQVGYDAERFHKDIATQVVGATQNRHVGQGGFIIITDENFKIVSNRYGDDGENLFTTGISPDMFTIPQGVRFKADVYKNPSYCMYEVSEGYNIISCLPESEALFTRNLSIYVTVFMEIVVFVGLFIFIYFLIKWLVVNNIHKVNEGLAQITGGNLDVVVDVRENEEFASLSDDINSTVNTLKKYISEAAARIDKELEFAKAIQHSLLPSVFPPYPNRFDFDIYARMDTAKEVGGDFYDFYLTSHNELVFLVADVSGKGIPAAMFMMRAKTLIKDYAETGMSVEEVFTKANEKLCESNDAEMFVTAWIGKIDLTTGLVTFANAGHNPPLVRQGDGSYEYLKSRPSLVLAGMEGIKYRKNELQLNPGDTIFLYTDGVTEATNSDTELYGDSRLQSVLNTADLGIAMQCCDAVKDDVDKFVGDAPQFDDITMLCLRYNGGDK